MHKFSNLFKNINDDGAYDVSDISRIIGVKNNLNLTFIQVPTGVSTKYHNHKDYEVWLITAGQGQVCTRSQNGDVIKREVCAGDLLLFHPFNTHQITNTGGENLNYISTWWENWDITEKLSDNFVCNRSSKLFIIACPTPNGPLHLGHLSGPYFLADLTTKKLELEGIIVKKASGTFGYTSHIQNTAKLKNTNYETLVYESENQIIQDFKNFGLRLDDFVTHNIEENADFNKFLHDTIKKYIDNKIFYEKKELHFFDNITNAHISEANIQGICSFCGDKTLGIECENCGAGIDNTNLLNATAIFSNNILEQTKHKSLFWSPDSNSLDIVAEHYIKLANEFDLYIPNILNDIVSYYKTHPVPISIFQEEGIVLDKYAKQTLSSFAQRLLVRLYWYKKYKNINQVVFFNGTDNFTYSTFLVSVFLYERFGFLDSTAITNELSLLNNKKFSTSKNHVIWAKDFFKKNQNSDYLRLYFAYIYHHKQSVNFVQNDFEKFQIKYSNLIKQLMNSAVKLILKYNKDITSSGSWTSLDRIFFDNVNVFYLEAFKFMDIYSLFPNKIFIHLDALISIAQQYISDKIINLERLQDLNKKTAIYLSAYAIWCLLRLLYPLMPTFTEQYIYKIYGVNNIFGIMFMDMPDISIKKIYNLELL